MPERDRCGLRPFPRPPGAASLVCLSSVKFLMHGAGPWGTVCCVAVSSDETSKATVGPIAGRLVAVGATMSAGRDGGWRRVGARLLAGTVVGACAVGGVGTSAHAATTATFASGVLTVVGDGADKCDRHQP